MNGVDVMVLCAAVGLSAGVVVGCVWELIGKGDE